MSAEWAGGHCLTACEEIPAVRLRPAASAAGFWELMHPALFKVRGAASASRSPGACRNVPLFLARGDVLR